MFPIFFYHYLFIFFIKNSIFYKYADIYYKKEQYEKYYFIYSYDFMYYSSMFNKSSTTQNN